MLSTGSLIVVLDGIALGMMLFTVAAGLALSYAAAGVLNLAHAMFWLTGAYVGATLTKGSIAGLGLALIAATGTGLVCGYLVALLMLATSGVMLQALLSVGVALVGDWVLTLIFGVQPLSAETPEWLSGPVTVLGRSFPRYWLLCIAIGTGAAIALWWFLARTRTGARVRASAHSPQVLETLGVNSRRIRTWVVASACAVAAAAGVLGGPLLAPSPGSDHTILVLSLVIVVAGGARSVPGIVLASLLVGQIQTTAVVVWPDAASILPYAVLVAALFIRSLRQEPGHST
jgi:branched-chain amino acid transport system permease protein